MTDSPNRGQWGDRDEPTQAFGGGYPGPADPAYASQMPYGPPYPPQGPAPTQPIPGYPPYGYGGYAGGGQYPPQYPPGQGGEPPEPDGPKSPRWLWIVAGIAVLTVIGLVIALVIVNSSQQDTMVAPLPAAPEPSFSPPTVQIPTTTSRTPPRPVLPLPTPSTRPSTPPPTATFTPGVTDTVVYTVTGSGRAINITYVDTGGLLQTEFNVTLPWSREVTLPRPGEDSASISIINVGREVSCSITVNGAQIEERTGAGLTICAATR